MRYFRHHRTHSLNRALISGAPILFVLSLIFFLLIRGSQKFEKREVEPAPMYPPEIVSTENEAYFADSTKLDDYIAQLRFAANSASRWLELEDRLTDEIISLNFSNGGHYVGASTELFYQFVDSASESLELRAERDRVKKLHARFNAELDRAQRTPRRATVPFRERLSDELAPAVSFLRHNLARIAASLSVLHKLEVHAESKTQKSHFTLNRTLHEKGYRELADVALRLKH